MPLFASGASIGRTGAVVLSLAAVSPEALAETDPTEQGIIDGAATVAGSYPATGALLRGRRLLCTATLIAPDVAITAAHCLRDDGWGSLEFTLATDLEKDLDEPISVSTAHAHPAYRDYSTDIGATRIGRRDDLGLVILERPVDGVPVEQIDMRGAVDLEGRELSMCGYGRTIWPVAKSAGLKQDAILIGGSFTPWELETIEEGPQPCRGDSGAPVFIETPAGRRIIGLVSRALGTSHMCDGGAIHTRVAPYAEWIEEASRDREEGCSAGGSSSAGPVFLAALLGWLLRRRSAARRDPAR